ncbi:pilus assembly protein [Pseudoalteromonas sp. T1lg65]|uniref:pilus assembly protein n=1 Tax=Pseudoalteromonas sp. T1lg65 TaxID=2077101 RepID=UPI003F797714
MKKYVLLWVCSLLFIKVSLAEDIELYVNHNVSLDEKPRVMIMFDTSGSMLWDSQTGKACYELYRYSNNGRGHGHGNTSWAYREVECFRSTVHSSKTCYQYNENLQMQANICSDSRLTVAKKAMKDLITKNRDIEFGLSRFYSSYGGYILNGIGANPSDLITKIDNLPGEGYTPLSEMLWELYLYLKGGFVKNGYNGGSDRDTSIEHFGQYVSPFKRAAGADKRCDNSINVILMTDGEPTADTEVNYHIKEQYRTMFGSYPPSFDLYENNWLTQNYLAALAKVMRGTSDVKVDLYPNTPDEHDFARIFAIGFGNGMTAEGQLLLKQTAEENGGGKFLQANTADELVKALDTTIVNIRNVSASFSSPTVSVNAKDQTQSGDNLYYTMFEPETHTRWKGNLKKLKIKDGAIRGQENTKAINSDGLIGKNITTYWSVPGSKDGQNIEAGGVNYALEQQNTRKVLSNFNKSYLSELTYQNARIAYRGDRQLARAMKANVTELPTLISWARGIDVDDEDGDGSRVDSRADIFADPLHSKPVTMNYGNGDIRILVGTNAGFLHMFKDEGNRVKESWAFIPEVLLPNLKPIKNKQPESKLYGMDGPITIHFNDINENGVVDSGEKVWAFAGMRRGGNRYYGFDITNPDDPKLLWGKPIIGGEGDFKYLGQTWSKPFVTFLENQKERPVLIFTAGYDTNKDKVNKSPDSVGIGLYIVDIMSSTPKVIWSLTPDNGFKGQHSIAASATVTDSDYDGFSDRIYMADTGGSIWRIDMPGPDTTQWSHFELARLAGNTANHDRRFFYQPTIARTFYSRVTRTTDSSGNMIKTRKDIPFEALVIGSGNRAKPTNKGVDDYLFMIRDLNTKTQSFAESPPTTIKIDNLMEMKSDPFGNALTSMSRFTDLEVTLGQYKGWKYQLNGSEKSLSAATVVGGVAYYTTFTPANQSIQQCTLTGGKGQMYAFHLHYGSGKTYITAQDLPDTPTVVVKNKDNIGDSVFWFPGPGLKSSEGDALTPFLPTGISTPEPVMTNGKIQLFGDISFGIRTRQLYIYKREKNDEK